MLGLCCSASWAECVGVLDDHWAHVGVVFTFETRLRKKKNIVVLIKVSKEKLIGGPSPRTPL